MFSFLRRMNVVTRRDLSCFFNYSSSSIVRFISTTTDSTPDNTFAISYLINTCGVPKQKAISATKGVHFESSKKPDSVIALFRDSGFSSADISKLTGKYPMILLCSVDKTLKPKLDFFKSQGIAGSDLAAVFCQDQCISRISLKRKIIPNFGIFKSIVKTDSKLIALLKRSPGVLMHDPHKNLIPNVALLRAQGVPADNVEKLLLTQPRALLMSTSRFREIVEEVKHMKFNPSQYMFLVAVHGLTSLTKSSLEAKFDVYRRWGLSEDEVQLMFRKFPCSVMFSEKKFMSTMNYFVNEMGYTPSMIAKQPIVLAHSLTSRIIPRCSVIQILISKGLVGNDSSLSAFLQQTEETFLKKYVIKFEKEVPELLAIYRWKNLIIKFNNYKG